MPDLQKFIHDIKALHIQGAKQIAIESLKFLKLYSKEKGFGKDFDKAMNQLEGARPTAVVLHNCLEILRKDKSLATMTKLISQLNSATEKIAERGSREIKNGSVIMTHCHSGEALSVIERAWKSGKKISVIATETSPREQGIITAKELAAAGIPVTLITDAAEGFFMPEVDMVILGSDGMRRQGNLNKIGSYPLALLARQHKKPYYVVGSTFKLDRRKKYAIEERSTSEVYPDLKGVKIRNPSFDLCPWRFVYRIITEKGIFTPGNIVKMLK
ncbi:MAG TPA: S-methyl-5-thioribose-1-phosphate isomerase [archaeon]|nr:S-methyl-5-thioribose-1-phosphate isomerase [archaeon]